MVHAVSRGSAECGAPCKAAVTEVSDKMSVQEGQPAFPMKAIAMVTRHHEVMHLPLTSGDLVVNKALN